VLDAWVENSAPVVLPVLAKDQEGNGQRSRDRNQGNLARGVVWECQPDDGRGDQVDPTQDQGESETPSHVAELAAKSAGAYREDADHNEHDQDDADEEALHERSVPRR